MKDTQELRAFLVEQMKAVAAGEVDVAKAKAMSNFSQQIYNTLSLEIRMAQALQTISEKAIKPVPFGTSETDAQ